MQENTKKHRSEYDRKYMELAVDEMILSRSEHVYKPDPLVGVVLVDENGKEFVTAHRGIFGNGDHAEFSIFEKAIPDTIKIAGGTLYVTLEPCTKREPPKKPCAKRAVDEGIARVVIGMLDPNPDMYSKGVRFFEDHGIVVDFFDDDLVEEINYWNQDFVAYMLAISGEKEGGESMSNNMDSPSREETRPIWEADVSDLSVRAIKTFLKYYELSYEIPSEELWKFFWKSKYVRIRGGRYVPTVAGIVLFGETPDIFVPEHFVIAESFYGLPEDGMDLDQARTHKRISGPLHRTVNDIVSFYKKNAAKVPRVEGLERDEGAYEYPTEVVREAIINALIHRNYELPSPVTFRMFRNSIVVKSPGHILKPNTLERMREFDVTPVRRNPYIARAASKMKLMDLRGGGIPAMLSDMEAYQLLRPRFDFEDECVTVTLPGREMSPPSLRLPSHIRAKLTDKHIDVLNLIGERKRITSKGLTVEYGYTRETANQYLRKLRELGLIEKKGKGRATYYVLK